MSIIRITEGSTGLAQYLRDGRKAGRAVGRDVLDQRVPLYGDLAAFDDAVRHSRRHKRWKRHYWHLTIGFAPRDRLVPDATRRAVVRDVLSYYFGLYTAAIGLAAYAEAHDPRLQRIIPPQSDEPVDRLPHIHLAVAKLDTLTGRQIRCVPYLHRADRAFQAWLAAKHGLADPADHRRMPSTARRQTPSQQRHAQEHGAPTGVRAFRQAMTDLLRDCQGPIDAKRLLSDCTVVAQVVERFSSHTGNAWLQVTPRDPTLPQINLRGRDFHHVVRTVHFNKSPVESELSLEQLEEVWRAHVRWFQEQQYRARTPRTLNHGAISRRVQQQVMRAEATSSARRKPTIAPGNPSSPAAIAERALAKVEAMLAKRQPESDAEGLLLACLESRHLHRHRNEVQRLDATVDAQRVLAYAEAHLALAPSQYDIMSDNRITHRLIPARGLRCSEFLRTICAMRVNDIITVLRDLETAQTLDALTVDDLPPLTASRTTPRDLDVLAEDADIGITDVPEEIPEDDLLELDDSPDESIDEAWEPDDMPFS